MERFVEFIRDCVRTVTSDVILEFVRSMSSSLFRKFFTALYDCANTLRSNWPKSLKNGTETNSGRKKKVDVPRKWIEAHERIKNSVIENDTELWQKNRSICERGEENLFSHNERLRYVAGVDLSYVKHGHSACAALVVCRLPDMAVVYENFQMTEISVPYVAGFLTFREVLPILESIKLLLIEAPRFKPQVILVDGNGLLHPREAGLACHLGVLTDIPCVGVAKNLFKMDQIDFESVDVRKDLTPLTTREGKILGKVVKSGKQSTKPVYVSVGHRINLDTAVWLVKLCSIYRVPEPIRQADIRSRDFVNKELPRMKKCSRPVELHR